MTKRNPGTANLETYTLHDDASGMPCVLSYRGYVFACDFLGEVKINLIHPASGSRRDSKIAADVVRRAYAAMVAQDTDADWIERNRAMYAKGG